MNLNNEQSNAYNSLLSFVSNIELLKNGPVYFLLDGPGGSGKTFLIKNLLPFITTKYKILAPTHKACSVIKESLNNVGVSTIAKFLGYTEEINDDGEKIITYTYFQRNDVKLLIIDECSMISNKQLDVLLSTNINIIFIGDACQLSPVSENISKVFSLNFSGSASLKKNERIKDKNIAEIITEFRHSVSLNFLKKKAIDNNSKICSRKEFDKKLIESFAKGEDTIYIAWTNTQVKKYNEFIRNNLFGENAPSYVEGEKIIFTEYFLKGMTTYYTNMVCTIKSCKKVMYRVYNPRCICKEYLAPFEPIYTPTDVNRKTRINKCPKCHTSGSAEIYKEIEFWEIVFKGHDADVFLKPVNGISELYNIIYKYRDRCKIMKDRVLWAKYYNMAQSLNAPIDYSYSITVHKSQGSGYNNVFVDLHNILWCQDQQEKLRLAYTAISRVKENLYFFKPL